MEVWWGGWSCLLWEGGRRMDRMLVGVDISKDSFSASGLDAEGNECFSGSYSMDSEGFGKFLEKVMGCRQEPQKVLVGMESTGCYHLNLFSYGGLISGGDPGRLFRYSLSSEHAPGCADICSSRRSSAARGPALWLSWLIL